MKLRVYLGQAMSNRYCDEILAEARQVLRAFSEYPNIEVWSPALIEGIPDTHTKLTPKNKQELLDKWMVDKRQGLRSCHAMYIASGDMTSRGIGQERGHTRWYLWRIVLRKHEGRIYHNITDFEEDGVVFTHRQAARYLAKRFPTRWSWIKFKINHILTGIPKFVVLQLGSLWL